MSEPESVPQDYTHDDALVLIYRNHRGEVNTRRVIPNHVWFGTSQWHPGTKQWFLFALDLDKDKARDFALNDIIAVGPGSRQGIDDLVIKAYRDGLEAAAKKVEADREALDDPTIDSIERGERDERNDLRDHLAQQIREMIR